MHHPGGLRISGLGDSRPVTGRFGVWKKDCIDGQVQSRQIDKRIEFFWGRRPPVGKTPESLIVEGSDELFRVEIIDAVPRRPLVSPIGHGVAVVPCILIVRIVGVGVIRVVIQVLLHLPDQAGHIVPHHDPFPFIVGKFFTAMPQFCIGNWVVVTAVLRERIARRRAVDFFSQKVVTFGLAGVGDGAGQRD